MLKLRVNKKLAESWNMHPRYFLNIDGYYISGSEHPEDEPDYIYILFTRNEW